MQIPDQYAVMGNPIVHSQSPFIHQQFAQQTGENLTYQALLVDTEAAAFPQAVQDFQQQGGKGLNITVPFKQAAWQLADCRQPRAEKAGAVNTLWFDEQGKRIGDNTDGVGLVRDLTENHQYALQDKTILILGAGGAVRGVLEPILAAQPARCVIANRTVAKAEQLTGLFPEISSLFACGFEELTNQQFDLIINGTSASLQGQLPALPANLLHADSWIYDMMYAATDTAFMQWGKQQGAAKTLDGLGMLVEQAAEAFYLWRTVRPNTTPIICQLRLHLIIQSRPQEVGGPTGPEPTRYGDWEQKGRCIDF